MRPGVLVVSISMQGNRQPVLAENSSNLTGRTLKNQAIYTTFNYSSLSYVRIYSSFSIYSSPLSFSIHTLLPSNSFHSFPFLLNHPHPSHYNKPPIKQNNKSERDNETRNPRRALDGGLVLTITTKASKER